MLSGRESLAEMPCGIQIPGPALVALVSGTLASPSLVLKLCSSPLICRECSAALRQCTSKENASAKVEKKKIYVSETFTLQTMLQCFVKIGHARLAAFSSLLGVGGDQLPSP